MKFGARTPGCAALQKLRQIPGASIFAKRMECGGWRGTGLTPLWLGYDTRTKSGVCPRPSRTALQKLRQIPAVPILAKRLGVRWLAGNRAGTALAWVRVSRAKAVCALAPHAPHSKSLAKFQPFPYSRSVLECGGWRGTGLTPLWLGYDTRS